MSRVPERTDGAVTWLDWQLHRIERRRQLLRGRLVSLRGAQVGARFGLGRRGRLLYPSCFAAGDDVTVEEYFFLQCLSEKGVRIGSHTSIGRNLWLHCGGTSDDYSHGYFHIGEHSYVGCNAVLGAGGGIRIGSHVIVGQTVNMHAENHRFEDREHLIKEQGVRNEGIVVEDDVWVGSKVTILDGVTVGRGAVIGAGAVVARSIPPYAVAVGVPARVIRYRGESEA